LVSAAAKGHSVGMGDSILNIALSGLNAASQRLSGAANNIANALDTAPLTPQADQPQPYQPVETVQNPAVGGGTVATSRPVTPASEAIYDPNSPFADNNGLVATPNVDLAQQLVQTQIASVSYQANAKVIQADQNINKATLDLFA